MWSPESRLIPNTPENFYSKCVTALTQNKRGRSYGVLALPFLTSLRDLQYKKKTVASINYINKWKVQVLCFILFEQSLFNDDHNKKRVPSYQVRNFRKVTYQVKSDLFTSLCPHTIRVSELFSVWHTITIRVLSAEISCPHLWCKTI